MDQNDNISLEQDGNRATFHLIGDVENDLINILSKKMNALLEENRDSTVILEMSKVVYIDSSAIGVLITLVKNLRASGKHLYILTPSPFIISIMKETCLDQVFRIADNLDMLNTLIDKDNVSSVS